jgi:P27 family predicted phage terminase small subunit
MAVKKKGTGEELPAHLEAIRRELQGQVAADIPPAAMEAICVQMHRMRTAQERISEEGIVVADPKGNPVPHPALAVEKQASAELRTWLKLYPY